MPWPAMQVVTLDATVLPVKGNGLIGLVKNEISIGRTCTSKCVSVQLTVNVTVSVAP